MVACWMLLGHQPFCMHCFEEVLVIMKFVSPVGQVHLTRLTQVMLGGPLQGSLEGVLLGWFAAWVLLCCSAVRDYAMFRSSYDHSCLSFYNADYGFGWSVWTFSLFLGGVPGTWTWVASLLAMFAYNPSRKGGGRSLCE